VILVRHARTVVDPAVPSFEWRLSPQGRAAAAALELPPLHALTSPEPKAVETAVAAGLQATIDERLREVARPWEDAYEEQVRRYLAGDEPTGWERRADALARLHAALDGFDGIAVTHRLAIALFTGLAFEAWRALPFPAVLECR
jgi:broad specificity phosphatase PhoE